MRLRGRNRRKAASCHLCLNVCCGPLHLTDSLAVSLLTRTFKRWFCAVVRPKALLKMDQKIFKSSSSPTTEPNTSSSLPFCFCFIFRMFASCCNWMCPDSSGESSGENEGQHNSYTNSAFSSPPSPQHEHSCKACGLCFGTHAKKVISPTC